MSGDRDALLIANGVYDSAAFRALRSPAQDAAGLAEVLGDPEIGGFRVESVTDMPAHQVSRAVERFFRGRGRDDTLLLHLSCHGVKNDDGRLYFAARDTDRELLESTAVPAAFVQAQMDRCRARTVVVLLDCCYSGAFMPGSKGDDDVHVRDELAGSGRVVLTATNRTEYAWEGEHAEPLVPQLSRFTGAVVQGLRSGAADLDRDGRVTTSELYDYVYETVRGSGAAQTPRMWADVEYQVVLARVPREPERLRERLPERGRDALVQIGLTVREAALGTEKDVPVDTAVRCPRCGGTGVTDGRTMRCAECGGEGRVRRRRTLTVAIPGGVTDGLRIQLSGEGETGPGGGPPADLYLEIKELPDIRYTRDGDDLAVVEGVAASLLAEGTTVTLDTLDGPVTVRVPAGFRPGETLRVKGRGAKRLRQDSRGDLLVKVVPRYSGNRSRSIRVYELAKDLGVESKVVMTVLRELGKPVRSASSPMPPGLLQQVTDVILGVGSYGPT